MMIKIGYIFTNPFIIILVDIEITYKEILCLFLILHHI